MLDADGVRTSHRLCERAWRTRSLCVLHSQAPILAFHYNLMPITGIPLSPRNPLRQQCTALFCSHK